MIKFFNLLLLLLVCTAAASAQQKIAELKAPAGFADKNDAAGYYNKYNQRFILCQQKGDSLYRLMCDSGFRIMSQYSVFNKEITYRPAAKKKKRHFLTDLATDDYHYEIYWQDDQLFVYRLNFEAGTDEQTAAIKTKSTYPDESLLAVMPSGRQLRYMTHSKKQNILLLYTCNPAGGSTEKLAFQLPKTNLSEEEVKRYNSEIKLKLAKDITEFSVERMDKPNVVSMPAENRIFYNDSQAFLLIKMPFNTGYHVIRILFGEGAITQKNLFINSLEEDYYCGDLEKKKLLTVTMADSVLIVSNNNSKNLQLHFFNASTLAPLKSYNINVTDSIQPMIHSRLMQKGTWGSENEIKELSNKELYFRRKHQGEQYLAVSALNAETIVLTSGSFIETGSPAKLLYGLATVAINVYLRTGPPADRTTFVPGFSTFAYDEKKFKYLYTHSKFLRTSLEPAGKTNVSSFLDVINEQVTGQRFNRPSSFFMQQGDSFYIGLFNKEAGSLEVLKYAQ